MSVSNDTIDYTIRGNSAAVDKVITQLAAAAGIPKSTFIRNKLEEIFQNRYDQYAASSSLVAAYDEILARELGTTVKSIPIDNFMTTPKKIAMCEILKIKDSCQLESVLINNGKYILHRARQTMFGNSNVPVLTASSLWFALFCELAGTTQEQVKEAENRIFNKFKLEGRYYEYMEDINAIRELKGIQPLPVRDNDAETKYCQVRIYKPKEYQYGAWRVEIFVSKESQPVMEEFGICYPVLKNRLLIADSALSYQTAVLNSDKEYESGFLFKNGECQLDLYSSGISEELNPTPISEVAEVLKNHINDIIIQRLG